MAHDDLISSDFQDDSRTTVKKLQSFTSHLPDANYRICSQLMNHLLEVTHNKEYNKMDIKNLALLFGPTLFRSSFGDLQPG